MHGIYQSYGMYQSSLTIFMFKSAILPTLHSAATLDWADMVRTVIYTILLAASTAWFFYPLRGSPSLPEQKVKQQMC